jgi:hypothetical protein
MSAFRARLAVSANGVDSAISCDIFQRTGRVDEHGGRPETLDDGDRDQFRIGLRARSSILLLSLMSLFPESASIGELDIIGHGDCLELPSPFHEHRLPRHAFAVVCVLNYVNFPKSLFAFVER